LKKKMGPVAAAAATKARRKITVLRSDILFKTKPSSSPAARALRSSLALATEPALRERLIVAIASLERRGRP
jgi:hypothetical protein